MRSGVEKPTIVVVLDRSPAVLKEGWNGEIIGEYSAGGAANVVVPKIEEAIAAGYKVMYVTAARTKIERKIARDTAISNKPYVFRTDGRQFELYFTDTDEATYDVAREDFFGAYLWFAMQNQFSSDLIDKFDRSAMEASRRHNRNQAKLIAKIAPLGAYVLVEDQQGLFVGSELRNVGRTDLRSALFIHSSVLDPKARDTFRGRRATPREFVESAVKAWQGFHAVLTQVPWQKARVKELIESFASRSNSHVPELDAAPVTIVPAEVIRNFDKAVASGQVAEIADRVSGYDEVVIAGGRTEPYKNLAASIGFAETRLCDSDERDQSTLFVLQVTKTREGIPAYQRAYKELTQQAEALRSKFPDNVMVVEDNSYETVLALTANATVYLCPAVEEGLQIMPLEAALVNGLHASRTGRRSRLAIIASDSAGVSDQLRDVVDSDGDVVARFAVHAHFKDPLRFRRYNVEALNRAYEEVIGMSEADRVRMANTAANQAMFNQHPLNHLEASLSAADRGFEASNRRASLQFNNLT